MKTIIEKLFTKLQNMNVIMCSYRDAWQIQARRTAEIRNMNEHSERKFHRPNEVTELASARHRTS